MATKGKPIGEVDMGRIKEGAVIWVDLYSDEKELLMSKEARVCDRFKNSKGLDTITIVPAGFVSEIHIHPLDGNKGMFTSDKRKGIAELFFVASYLDKDFGKSLDRAVVEGFLSGSCTAIPKAMKSYEECVANFVLGVSESLIDKAPVDRDNWKSCHYQAEAVLSHSETYRALRDFVALIESGKFVTDKLFLLSRDGFNVNAKKAIVELVGLGSETGTGECLQDLKEESTKSSEAKE